MTPQMDAVGVPVVTPAQVFDMLDGGLARENVGPLAGNSLLAVDIDDAKAPALAAVARHLPCVVVGIGSLPRTLAHPPDLDVLLTDVPNAPRPWRSCPEGIDRALSTLTLSVLCAPRAATALVQVLRMGRDLSFDDALVAESLAYSTLQAGSEFKSWLESREPRPPRPRDEAPVEVTRRDGTLVVRLQRPHVRNAVDAATRDALVQAFDLAALDPTIDRVDFRGAGPAFCAGGDLDEFGTTPDPVTAHLVRVSRSPARALRRCADRTTAHVHGACIGAGIELAALAARVVAAPDATFQLPEIRMGLIPGAGGTVTIPRRIGRQRTAWMALTGAVLDAETALDWGLVDIA
ncbi:MAG TPA: enoyl-CoA hydratase/isomerase family protein [Acidimicrobiales bacterium]